MGDPDDSAGDGDDDRLAQLDARIARLRHKKTPPSRRQDEFSQAHLAWRMVIELVTGLLIGFGMGYGLDALFGTMPLFLVLFILLGLAAGIRTMMRSAREVQQQGGAGAGGATDDETSAPRAGTDGGKRAKDGD